MIELPSALKDYCDFIYETQYRMPDNYQVIQFDKFLSHYFSKQFYFMEATIIEQLRNKLKATFGTDRKCFIDYGSLMKINFTKLQYYQSEVGIDGPKFSGVNDPVSILQIGSANILYDGYHRAFKSILKQETSIQAYVLELKA